MKRLTLSRKSSGLSSAGKIKQFEFLKRIKFPKIPFSFKWFVRISLVLLVIFVLFLVLGYVFVARPILAIASEARELKASTSALQKGLEDLNIKEIKIGIEAVEAQLTDFENEYRKNMNTLRKLPNVESYYQDGERLLAVGHETIELGKLTLSILEPYAVDLGLATDGESVTQLTAKERIVKLMRLMPQFSPKVQEISDRVSKIDSELSQIDASKYPTQLPGIVSYFGIDPNINIQEQILGIQSISNELAAKAPEFEAFFNAIPEFMGLNEPKRYLILMANNYELRMSGGFNTYIVVVEFVEGVPEIIYSIDTYNIDEGARTGSSFLVNRNVPYFLSNYLYIQGRNARLYARDATSSNADFPLAANTLLDGFWFKDRSLPQEIDGVIQINNDLAVDILKVVGPVNTEKYSIKTDSGNYITIPVTEFNSENVIEELENIAGGKLAEIIGRKEIIKFLGQSILEKMYNSEATNLVNIVKVLLDSMSKKDVVMYSFDPVVQKAFEDLGYGGRIKSVPEDWDYLHVNRSNFGSGKADWTGEGFVTMDIAKNLETKDGKKISTVQVKIKNPKRPDWFNIDPCCFYKGYTRVYVPKGSRLISVSASDGQDPKGAEFVDEELGKTYIESYTVQPKETDLTITYIYELPDTVNTDNYNLLIQRQSGASIDPYKITVGSDSTEVLLNADKEVTL